MKKGRRILLVFAGLALACVLITLLWPQPKEPEYNGKKLSQWVWLQENRLGEWGPSDQTTEARNAIKALGTNALPWLLKWIAYEPSSSKTATYRFLKRLHIDAPYRGLERADFRSVDSTKAFRWLGPAVQSAIPKLNGMMTNSASYNISARAQDSLAFIGEPAVPWLLTALTNQWRYRHRVPGAFVFMCYQRTDIRSAIPILIALLKDPDQTTSESCAAALGQIGQQGIETDKIVDALIEATHDARPKMRVKAVLGLSGLPNASKTVLPALINSMDDPDPEVASYAIRMLARQRAHADRAVPALIKRLKPNDVVRERTQIEALANFGREARPAIPALLQIMDYPASPSVWIAASNAVWRIDPQALQK